MSFDTPLGGPRGLKGAETVRQGFVDINAIIDRDEIETRKANEHSSQVTKRMHSKTPDEWDVAYNEFLITPIMNDGYGDNDHINDIPVTSTAAGLKDLHYQNVNRVLDAYQPAGLSMTRIVYKPENASVIPEQRKLASQIAGSWTGDSYNHDMPFGSIVRLEVNQNLSKSHGYIGTNKLRLVPKPESNGMPFAMRLQQRMWEHFMNPMKINVDDKDKSKVDLAMDEVFEAFTDMMMIASIAIQEASGAGKDNFRQTIIGAVDPNDNALMLGTATTAQGKANSKKLRNYLMAHLFPGMSTNVKQADARFLFGGRVADTTTFAGKIQKLQLEASARFFEKMMDAVRADNIWAVAKVIRPCQGPGKFDAMFI